MKKKHIIFIVVIVMFIAIIYFLIFFNGLGKHWYGKELPSYFYEKGNDWDKLNFKEYRFIMKFKTSPRLRITNKMLYNQPWEGDSKFTDKGTYYDCDEGECCVYLYYYDGLYLHFLPLQHAGGTRVKKQKEKKCMVKKNTSNSLIVSDKCYLISERHKTKFSTLK